jgi:hypothetical protein
MLAPIFVIENNSRMFICGRCISSALCPGSAIFMLFDLENIAVMSISLYSPFSESSLIISVLF